MSVHSGQAAVELSMGRLMRNASRKARASGEKRIAARDIRKVTMVSRTAYLDLDLDLDLDLLTWLRGPCASSKDDHPGD